MQRFSFRKPFTSYLKTGKSISLAANPSDRNAKLDLLVGLCSRVLNPINTKFLVSQFFSQQFSSLGEEVWRSESIRLPLMWPGIESRIPNSTRSICQYSLMVSYEALRLNSKIVLFRSPP